MFPVDIGIAHPVEEGGLLRRHVTRGTRSIAKGPAMTRDEAVAAVVTGITLAEELKGRGYRLLAAGEMGIGNTTTAAAVTAVLLGRRVEEVTGRGAGLSDEGLERKIAVIRRAIEVNAPDPRDPLDVLSKVGGLDIAGMAGFLSGGRPPPCACGTGRRHLRRGRPAGCAALPGRGQGPHRQPQVSGALQRPAPGRPGAAPYCFGGPEAGERGPVP